MNPKRGFLPLKVKIANSHDEIEGHEGKSVRRTRDFDLTRPKRRTCVAKTHLHRGRSRPGQTMLVGRCGRPLCNEPFPTQSAARHREPVRSIGGRASITDSKCVTPRAVRL
jgi:hypothetical protein